MKVQLFDKDIKIKEYGCIRGHASAHHIPKAVNIFVKVTNACNARCLFCSNAGCRENADGFDHDKLWHVVDELIRQDIIVNRINLTGGEPSVVSEIVNEILIQAQKYSSIHLHLNTNGLLPSSQQLMRNPRWDSISMSLHHYESDKLSCLYGTSIPEAAFCFNGIDLSKVNASCNLIKGYIDSASEIEKMMRYALSLGLPRLGFVALMKVNRYCESHFVDYFDIDFSSIPNLYFTESRNRGLDCKCSNYLYNHKGNILEIYMRNYNNPQYCESSLLYDGQYFRQGFHNDNIII